MELYIVIALLIITIVGYNIFYTSQRKKLLSSSEVKEDLQKMENFLQTLVSPRENYFRNSRKEEIKSEYQSLYRKYSARPYNLLSKNPSVNKFVNMFSKLDVLVRQWNIAYVEKDLINNKDLFDNIDGRSLDKQQRFAVEVDEDNNIILAGAGTGKTLTISAKVKYLVDKKNVNPKEILLLSFTKKAAQEMQERIHVGLNIDIEAMTFHKLGFDIVTRYRGQRPDVFEKMSQVVNGYFEYDVKSNPELMGNLIDFFGYYLAVPKDLGESESLGDLYDYGRQLDFETLKSKVDAKINSMRINKQTIQGEHVRSLEEVLIANFLFLHGVKYSYEKKYPFGTGDPYRKQYRPDFYLDDYDIYLEHFGIDKNGGAPWLIPIEERKYLSGMDWKRGVHKRNQTTLIETYSFQNQNGELLRALDSLLQSRGVKYKPVDLDEVFEAVFADGGDQYFTEFKKLLKTFVELFKSRGFSEKDFDQLHQTAAGYKDKFLRQRTYLFLEIVKPLYLKYQEVLAESGQIDFNDMINDATEIVRQGLFLSPYKYIIIDEFQDISLSRYNLVFELKKQTNAEVVVVGDDWQSIYRFTGSDIDLFTSFEKYFGYSETLKIEQTYRNSQELVDIAGRFIMMNPKQLAKSLKSSMHNSSPIKIIGYNDEIDVAIEQAIDQIVSIFGQKTEILILGRTNFDIDVLKKCEGFTISGPEGNVKVCNKKYPELMMNYLTVHRAKGLEAENTIVINLENKLLGFPNKISDDPVLSLLLTDQDEYEFAEERRLFYVALTRTKNYTYLIVPDRNPSVFIDELKKNHMVSFAIAPGQKTIQNNPKCPVCKKGFLVLRENHLDGSQFLGCSNYPQCQFSLKNIEILERRVVCSQCGGFIVERNGKYGKFLGCTNYPFCKNSRNIP